MDFDVAGQGRELADPHRIAAGGDDAPARGGVLTDEFEADTPIATRYQDSRFGVLTRPPHDSV